MCGISIVIKSGANQCNPEEVEKLNNQIVHRGPDDSGVFVDGKLGLGHRRLSIIDVSASGKQPMQYGNDYHIVFNGEIYNYLELKKTLTKEGYSFSTETDTEVILAAYDRWKTDCFSKFNGMWAIAIYDQVEKHVILSRDRFGIKPLYYRKDAGGIRFGSELKQLLHKENPVNKHIVIESLLTSIDNHNEETYFKGIYSFPQSCFGIYNLKTDEFKIKDYYFLQSNNSHKNKTDNELITEFEELLYDSIKLRMRSDVKVGTCLSGGLDSSSISTIASKIFSSNKTNERFLAIHAKSEEKRNDESGFAQSVASHANLDIHYVEPTYQDFLKTIDEVVITQEEPFGSPSMFMGWHVFQKARSEGCTVMLNGQGGDEILFGYERYFASTLSIFRPLEFIKNIILQTRNNRQSLIETISYYFYFRSPTLRKWKLRKKSFLKKKYKDEKYFSHLKESVASYNNPDTLNILEITKIQLPHLLRYEDRSSMRHSIETRLPFLDYRLVEFCISLPTRLKLRDGWTKYILRRTVDGILPKDIVWRKNKFGFEAPEKLWINNYQQEMLREILSSPLMREICDLPKLKNSFHRLSLKDKWMYFIVARWAKVFNVISED